MAVILNLNDNGEYHGRKIIDNINIGEEYLCKGFVFFNEGRFYPIKREMIVEEIDKIGEK